MTPEDFEQSGWAAALGSAKRDGYSSMWSALSDAAKTAMENDEQAKGKVLWLLADACSMMLKPESVSEPYKPIMVMAGKRSALPVDFSESDLEFFGSIVSEIDEPRLQARIADIAWLCGTPRNPDYAIAAIDAYRSIPIETDAWVSDGGECWTRSAVIAGLMGNKAVGRLKEIAESARTAFHATKIKDGYLGKWLADLLVEKQLLMKDEVLPVAEHLESLGTEFATAEELLRARDYLRCAAKLFNKLDEVDRAADALVMLAEAWVAEAEKNESGMVSASFYENAIQVYREIPRSMRNSRNVDNRMAALRTQLSESGKRSLDEMGTIKTDEIDISKMVRGAREAVRGKTAVEALKAFTQLSHFNENHSRTHAIDTIKSNPLRLIFPATFVSNDGRVIAKSPGLDIGETTTGGNDAVVHREMINYHGLQVGIAIQGSIVPAYEVLLLEHRLTEADLVSVAHASPIVPPGRADLFGKALFAGYDQDFITAIHLLAPQVEHMVRYHLKAAGATTTMLDQQGVEMENSLSSLVDLPEMVSVFGADTEFEIRALFCDPFGPNLRNQVAHGLVDSSACRSNFVVYAWWFCLRLVFMTFWNAQQRFETESTGEGKS